MLVSKENIKDFIPHREPFVMVDALIRVTAEQFDSQFFIAETNVLVRDGYLQESGLMENIAQTCAASFGYLDRGQEGAPKMGFIGAITKVEVTSLPAVNSVITTRVTPLHQLGNIYLVKGENYCEGRILLGCEMKIVVTQ